MISFRFPLWRQTNNHPSNISTEKRWAFSINVTLTFKWKLGGVSPSARSSRSLGPSWWSCWGRGFFYLCGDVRWCIRHYILFHNTARRNKTTHQQTGPSWTFKYNLQSQRQKPKEKRLASTSFPAWWPARVCLAFWREIVEAWLALTSINYHRKA